MVSIRAPGGAPTAAVWRLHTSALATVGYRRRVSGIIDSLSQFMSRVVESGGYAGLLLVMLIENVVPPIPSEIVLPFAGFQVAEGTMNIVLVLLVTTLGGFAGTSLFYYLGKLLGDARVRQLIRRFGRYVLLREADYDEALTLFRHHDSKVVFWARFIPGVRSLISLPAGVAGMSFRRFAVFTLAGTVLWNSALVLAGLFLGSRWARVLVVVDRLESVLWVLLAVVVVGWFVWQRSKQARRRSSQAAKGSETTG